MNAAVMLCILMRQEFHNDLAAISPRQPVFGSRL
jgi:hypothetical protein